MFRIHRARLLALGGLALLSSVGCMTAQRMKDRVSAALGQGKPVPASLLITTFEPTLYHLPDPSKDGQLRPGLAGMMYLVDGTGQFTEVNGTFTVFIEDMTPRPPGVPQAIPEAWEFDSETLKRLRSQHEKFGKNTVVFLPWPDNWRGVTQLRISTKYDPIPEVGGPQLTGPVQPLSVSFDSPGRPLWTEKNEPFVMRGVPNVKQDLRNGFQQANMAMPQLGKAPLQVPQQPQQQQTVQTGAGVPQYQQVPIQQPQYRQPDSSLNTTLPALPPPMPFDGVNPAFNRQVGPNGATITTSAVALPAGQSLPPGWIQLADRTVVPAATQNATVVQPVILNQPIAPVQPRVQQQFDPRATTGAWANPGLPAVPPATLPNIPVPSQHPNSPLRTITIPGR